MAENFTPMVLVPQTLLEGLVSDMQEVKQLLKGKTAEEAGKEWIESQDARKMLGVSQKTWQTYRDKRMIPFSQVGRKIYVRRADLRAFMEQHKITK